ncbi:DNA-3-methyladenine glycosylase [Sulfobacillus harzensis]|uniref:Putative 3-methyladenine DNA glycosylase n=1 Tax=Sulfobacillus harzensis TaxID=2729629 RepID=A0A7Y0Q349_9FIRM|nr:DNA-3-methyladenine glycosylase [Sulfobacillus harzensis]NMP23207.1 DNA-3-methyladenine glycosylase [Sulfobacillus harzensis]
MSAIGRPVDSAFFLQDTESIARQLLGLLLVRDAADGPMAGRIVECEMYQGPDDRGAHSFGGKPTARTQVMFGSPGRAYVYLIYGMYECLNVVTAPAGVPHAILIRALEPIVGIEQMRAHIPARKHPESDARIAAGPGKLCRALDITRSFYGHPLDQPPLYLAYPAVPWPPYEMGVGPRINIDYAGEAAAYPWRFWVKGNASVSVRERPRT